MKAYKVSFGGFQATNDPTATYINDTSIYVARDVTELIRKIKNADEIMKIEALHRLEDLGE